MSTGESAIRKRRGAWYTPHELVELVVARTLDGWDVLDGDTPGADDPAVAEGGVDQRGPNQGVDAVDRQRTVRVLDPACGDGRFLVAAGRALCERGMSASLVGIDVDGRAVAAAEQAVSAAVPDCDVELVHGDALSRAWDGAFDVIVGNPPFLSQLASATSRGASSRFGGGPYADVAVEFLALSVDLAADGGRIGLILPQSVLASRDAAPVRADVDRRCTRVWSWWSPRRHFDADVIVCALGFERRRRNRDASNDDPLKMDPVGMGATASASETTSPLAEPAATGVASVPATRTARSRGRDRRRPRMLRGSSPGRWTDVVTSALGIPALPPLDVDGTIGDRAVASAGFRDEYYGLVSAVVDRGQGAPLVTSGLIDPGRCRWGQTPARFARRRFEAPTVELERLDDRMREWADRVLVPKVVVASQTQVVEAVADPHGRWLPCVPVITLVPDPAPAGCRGPVGVWEVAAVLTSPVASIWAWHHSAGTGLSGSALRVGTRVVSPLPWPAGDLDTAVEALRAGDVVECGHEVDRAFGVTDETTWRWWADTLPVRD